MASTKSPSPIDRHIGGRIRMRRTMIGMSQEKLANGLGITFQQVQKYEKGANRVGSGRLQQIADILGVQVTFFFEDQNRATSSVLEQAQPSPAEDLLTQRDTLQLVQAFATITNRDIRRAIVIMTRAIAGCPLDSEAGLPSESTTSHRKVSLHSS
ncbi:helix-turn-helix domain-containing protein [Microvirga sp. 2TAF3]|uniref:helix-turn-helix domain-containing protein n=1 Tax=Microvirga sp. 2TAF3 TaxID=3233014 RepID=UPI003F97CE0E